MVRQMGRLRGFERPVAKAHVCHAFAIGRKAGGRLKNNKERNFSILSDGLNRHA
jgi:hypothetical protein